MSVKFQITLSDDLASRLRLTARRMNIPLAQFIRETMEDRLRQLKIRDRRDPFAPIRGIVNSDETDLSSRVDEILYGPQADAVTSEMFGRTNRRERVRR